MEKEKNFEGGQQNQQVSTNTSDSGNQTNGKPKKKKTKVIIIVVIVILVICILFCAFGNAGSKNGSKQAETTGVITANISEKSEESDNSTDSDASIESETESEKSDESTLSVGDTWTVDGQWSIKINSIKETSDRNQFYDSNPAAVYVIDYTYKNLGYTTDVQDLYVNFSIDAKVIDAGGKVCSSYPAEDINIEPKETPVDASCDAQVAFGVETPGELTVKFHKYDSNYKSQEATFKLNPEQ